MQHQSTGWMHPANDPHTEHRMRLMFLEGRVDRLEQERNTEDTDSKPEPPRSVSEVAKDWAPVILSLIALAGVLTGKVSVEQAIGLLKGGP